VVFVGDQDLVFGEYLTWIASNACDMVRCGMYALQNDSAYHEDPSSGYNLVITFAIDKRRIPHTTACIVSLLSSDYVLVYERAYGSGTL
jgi:hypothetical protein